MQDLCRMDILMYIVFRRVIVGPAGDVDWILPWSLTTANGILMGNPKRTWTVRSHVVEFVVHL